MNKTSKSVAAGLFVMVIAAAACGGSGTSVTGTVGGQSFDAQDAVFITGSSASTTGTIVGMTTFGALCNAVTTNQIPKSSRVLSFQLAEANGTTAGPVTGPGTFDFLGSSSGATKVFAANWESFDATCTPTSTSATGGSVTVTAVTATHIAATFDVTFGTDHITGSFDASACAAPSSSGSPTCL
jgi:hypothetical protein